MFRDFLAVSAESFEKLFTVEEEVETNDKDKPRETETGQTTILFQPFRIRMFVLERTKR